MNLNKIIAFLCVFMYFASPYRLLGHALPEIIGAIAIILQTFQLTKVNVINGYGAFMIYMLFIPALISYMTGLPGNYVTSFIPISLILYSMLFCIVLPNCNKEYVLHYYRILVYIAVGLFFVQELSYYIVGYRPTLYLPLEMYYEGSDVAYLSESRSLMDRSSSFFLEPAHFAQYILPYYCIIVYKCIKNRVVSNELIIFSFVLLLLQSGSGYIGMLAIIFALILIKGLVPIKTKVVLILFLIIAIVVSTTVLYNNPFVIKILTRVNEITSLQVEESGSQSGFLRIWRGYFIYDNLPLIYKIFGVGTGSVEYVSNLIYIPGSRYEGSFMNGIQQLLVSGGILGTLLFLRFFIICLNRVGKEGKLILFCMLSIFFIENMLFTPKMFLYFLLAFSVSKVKMQQKHTLKVNNISYKSGVAK